MLYAVVELKDGHTPTEIQDDPKRRDFFQDCIGSLHGSHILAKVPADMQQRCRDHKTSISMNYLDACNFKVTFSYVLAGWESCAYDGGF